MQALVAGLVLMVALAAASLAPAAEQAAPTSTGVTGSPTTVVTVSMFEMGFKLSSTVVPTGTVVFEVVNDGKVIHDFRIVGKGTPILDPGERATLTVEFPTPGTYTFVCTVEGHAAAGMVGKLTVGVVAKPTVVAVSIYDKRFKLSKKVVPRGTVVFRIVNRGRVKHTFSIAGKRTKAIAPGRRARLTIKAPKPRRLVFVCRIKGHKAAGMVGVLVVR